MQAIPKIVLLLILAISTYTDFKKMIIEDEPLLFGFIFAVAWRLAGFGGPTAKDSWLGFFVGGLIFFVLCVFGGMGGGDVKLIAVIGYFFGLKLTIATVYLSFIFGGVMSLFYIIKRKGGLRGVIPFGPAICLAAAVVMFHGDYILNSFLSFLL